MDGAAVWTKLEEVHLQKVSGARYNALDAVFAVKQQSGESLPAVANRVDSLVYDFRSLCPDGYTVEQLIEDIAAMSMLRALPKEFHWFTSGLMQRDATKTEIVEALVREHALHGAQSSSNTSSSSPSTMTDDVAMQVDASASRKDVSCTFCLMKGHDEPRCFAKRDSMAAAQKKTAERQQQRKDKKKGGGQANEASASAARASAVEYCLNVSSLDLALSASLDPAADWLPDTGATRHMSGRRSYIHDLKLLKPRLAEVEQGWERTVRAKSIL